MTKEQELAIPTSNSWTKLKFFLEVCWVSWLEEGRLSVLQHEFIECHKVWVWYTSIIDHINFLKGWYKSAVLMVWSSTNSKFQGILV